MCMFFSSINFSSSVTGTVTKLDKLSGDAIIDDYLFKAQISIQDQIQTIYARRVILATGVQDQLEGYPEGVKGRK